MHPAKAFCTEYEKSKVLADRIALQAATEGVPITIVYPGVIYGPGKLTTGNLVSRIVSQLCFPFIHQISVIYSEIVWVIKLRDTHLQFVMNIAMSTT